MMFGNILETIRGCSLKIDHNVAHNSLYISTRNDVAVYFRSAANRTDVLFLVMFGSRFLDNGSTDFENVYCFVQALHLLLCKSLGIFASWPPKMGPKWPYRGDFDFLEKC